MGIRSRLILILVLALVVEGLFFLFEQFAGLTSGVPRDLLTTTETTDSTAETPSSTRFLAVLAPVMCALLGIGAAGLLRRRIKDKGGYWWPSALLGAAVVG